MWQMRIRASKNEAFLRDKEGVAVKRSEVRILKAHGQRRRGAARRLQSNDPRSGY